MLLYSVGVSSIEERPYAYPCLMLLPEAPTNKNYVFFRQRGMSKRARVIRVINA